MKMVFAEELINLPNGTIYSGKMDWSLFRKEGVNLEKKFIKSTVLLSNGFFEIGHIVNVEFKYLDYSKYAVYSEEDIEKLVSLIKKEEW